MSLEQQYPEPENFIDWTGDFQSSLLPTSSDPKKQKIKEFENHQGSIRLDVKLPHSGKTIRTIFASVPSQGEMDDFVSYHDRKASFDMGRLHPYAKFGLDHLGFDPNEVLNPTLIIKTGFRNLASGHSMDKDESVRQIAKIFGIQNPLKLYDQKSLEFQQLKGVILAWNKQKSGLGIQNNPSIAKSGTAAPVITQRELGSNNDLKKYIVNAEDIYSKDGFDRGGATKYGLIRSDFNPPKSEEDIKRVKFDQAWPVYLSKYWNKSPLAPWGITAPKDIPNKRLAMVIFDTGVNPLSDPPEFKKGLVKLFNDPNLTPDEKADAIMQFRMKMYMKYALPYARTRNEQRDGRIALVNRIKYKLMPFVGPNPSKLKPPINTTGIL